MQTEVPAITVPAQIEETIPAIAVPAKIEETVPAKIEESTYPFSFADDDEDTNMEKDIKKRKTEVPALEDEPSSPEPSSSEPSSPRSLDSRLLELTDPKPDDDDYMEIEVRNSEIADLVDLSEEYVDANLDSSQIYEKTKEKLTEIVNGYVKPLSEKIKALKEKIRRIKTERNIPQPKQRRKKTVRTYRDSEGQIIRNDEDSNKLVIRFDPIYAEDITPSQLANCNCCKKEITDVNEVAIRLDRLMKSSLYSEKTLICSECAKRIDAANDGKQEDDISFHREKRNPIQYIPLKKEKGTKVKDLKEIGSFPKYAPITSSLTVYGCDESLYFKVLKYLLHMKHTLDKCPLPAYIYFPGTGKCLVETTAFASIHPKEIDISSMYPSFEDLVEKNSTKYRPLFKDIEVVGDEEEETDY